MKVLKFEIQNYMALSGDHEVIPDGSSFFLVGANRKGKTSVGRILIDLLTKNNPSKPVTDGKHEGYVEVTFDDSSKLFAKYDESKKSPILTFITPDGMKAATPKDFFDRLAGPGMTFDINKFLDMQPKPKRAMLEGMVGIDLSGLNQEESMLMNEAKEIRAEVKLQKARVRDYDKKLIDKDEVDIKELSLKIAMAKSENKRDEQLKIDIKRTESTIAELRARIEEEELHLFELSTVEIETTDDFEIQVWESDLEEADNKNIKIRHAKLMHDEEEELEKIELDLKAKEEEIKNVRQAKEDAIRAKPLPADGLEFDPDGDGILLNGMPFEDAQIATSEKMIAALQIAESQLGKIRYLHFDAAILDKENALRVLAWAEKKDLQLCLERPLWDGGELTMEILDKTGKVIEKTKV